ncbi:MAG: hypothetical protein Kow00105_13130 [Phycisphaeraceae bacterium]
MTRPAPAIRIDPPLSQWTLGEPGACCRQSLVDSINRRAERLGTASLTGHAERLIATGHQAQLWHPGILVKDIAADVVANRLQAQRMHLIVDQDTNPAWQLDIPLVNQDTFQVRSWLFPGQHRQVPTGYQPPADRDAVLTQLRAIGSPQLDRLIDAVQDLPDCRTLAEQVAVLLARLKRPYAGDIPVMMVSDLPGVEAYRIVLEQILHDAEACVSAYNRAVRDHPEAGMMPLLQTRELIEVPLWAAQWNRPRRRVYVDRGDSRPVFVYDDGEPIDPRQIDLLPRALLLTAVMRSRFCDLFIHGTGGMVYDRVTESWWRQWVGETLAPKVSATADLYLHPDIPLADHYELAQAIWYRHHLPHNLDRILKLNGPLVRRKHHLLAHMNDDRDRPRRRAAFREIHRINQELARRHPERIVEAKQAVERARVGLKNAEVLRRRDWFFLFYPESDLMQLRDRAKEEGVQCPA